MKLHHSFFASLSALAAGIALAGAASPAYAGWNDEGTSLGPQCSSVDVNDNGVVVGNCLSNAYFREPFVATSPGRPVALAPLTTAGNGGEACKVGGLTNAPTVSGVIVGSCEDANNVWQGVYWKPGNPTIPPVQLQPLPGIAGLLADVETSETAVNAQGNIIGTSINGTGNVTPVIWNTAGIPTILPPPLLGSNTNCIPVDINDAGTPSIVGNCPAGAAGNSKNLAVLWLNAASAYIILPVPMGASYCAAKEVNAAGQILGECFYLGTHGATPDTFKTVVWGPGGSGPTVLLTVNGGTSLRNVGVDMNASGQVAGTRLVAGGYTSAFFWNPSTGSNATGIAELPGGSRAVATGIADNGDIIGNGEANGLNEGFVWHPNNTLSVVPSLQSGGNDAIGAISKSGNNIAGSSETSHDGTGEENDATVEATP